MFKGHPRGLLIASLANMGERFGFYTMYAIFTLFLQAKYGYDSSKTGFIWASFLFGVYFLPLLGGFIADKLLGYGKTITVGIFVMFFGYLLLAMPLKGDTSLWLVIGALFTVALGTGLFKGNLQALVGNMYDDPKYSDKRDSAFTIFYMCINIGAMFAPTAAEAVNNYVLKAAHYTYDSRIPALAHKFLESKLGNITEYLNIARLQDANVTAETLGSFSQNYIDALSKSYHYAFGVACISLIISIIIFLGFKKFYSYADKTEKQKAMADKTAVIELSPEETKRRVFALFMVFFVVIFFWMSFHQNGLTMTLFARDYTVPSVGRFTNLWFDLFGLLPILLSVIGLVFALGKKNQVKTRLLGFGAFVLFGLLAYWRYRGYGESNPFTPQKFQHFNPFFIVALGQIVLGIYAWLRLKGKEPSSPRKIGYGMIITAIAFSLLIIASLNLPSPKSIGGEVSHTLVSPYWLISTYFMLTIAELFLSPIGISFVSRVAPPKYKGLAQGGWFAATSVGNLLVGLMGYFWDKVSLSVFWSILVFCCLLSASFIFIIIKRLEKASETA
ncbi:MAG TPA: peptide MFS transporter [Bacteroidales bacterium]|nr:peptide MFS transporter [Bacteroidales bacterium]